MKEYTENEDDMQPEVNDTEQQEGSDFDYDASQSDNNLDGGDSGSDNYDLTGSGPDYSSSESGDDVTDSGPDYSASESGDDLTGSGRRVN